MAKADRSLLKPSVYSVMIGIVYWIVWIMVFVGANIDPESSEGAILGAIATFGSFLIFYFCMGMTVNMIDVHVKGGTPGVGEAFRDAKQNFVAIVFLALISTIVELIAKAARKASSDSDNVGAAILFGIAAAIINAIWTMFAFLLLPAIIIEDASFGDAMRRVRSLAKGNYLLISIGEIGVRAVTNLIAIPVVLLLFFFGWLSFAKIGGTAGLVLGIGTCGTILCLFAAFASYLRMAYYTCLYIWAAEVKDKGEQAQIPIPIARALNR